MITHRKQCLHCKADFVSKRSDAKYCSGSCRVLALIEREKLYWQKEEEEREKYNEEQYKRFLSGKKQTENQAKQNEHKSPSAPQLNKDNTETSKNQKSLQDEYSAIIEKMKKESIEKEIEDAKKKIEEAKQSICHDISRLLKKNIGYHKKGKILKTFIKSSIRDIERILNSPNSEKMSEDFSPLVFLKEELLPFFENLQITTQKSERIFVDYQIPEDLMAEHEIIYAQVNKES